MEGFGERIELSAQLDEDFIPAHTGFISTASDLDVSTETDDLVGPKIQPRNDSQSSFSSSSGNRSGMQIITAEFKSLRSSISLSMNKPSEEQKLVANSVVSQLILHDGYRTLIEYYNLNSHLISPVHLFKAVLELGGNPNMKDIDIWKYRFEGIVMEKQLMRESEYQELKLLCSNTCRDIQKLVINVRSESDQFSTLVTEAKSVQMTTHDTLIQLQEFVNELKAPDLPSAKRPGLIPSELQTEWIIPPIKVSHQLGVTRIKLGKVAENLDETKIFEVAKVLKLLSLKELQLLKNVTITQLIELYKIAERPGDAKEFVTLLSSFVSP
ncbi:hypothetical protein QKO74_gp2 [hymenopteran rhabdo-related virus 24]|uniref:Uncharacterized protein n=1 Tax=hymenopteran rhabdo-related virus 24 TaxID=2847805 RepID=A0A7U3NUT5_9RHAB|nr:hypothetical protein QKO74_gp2 [hymenopteran rhabdo-related virus 24]QPB73980.1 hypothetical protein [hymenopteran rhabdo-related virus 24]